MPHSYDYDAIVIGSGPGGEGAAMGLVKQGARVAVIERYQNVGGGCTHWGTIPSKAIRHAVSRIIEFNQNPLYSDHSRLLRSSFADILNHADNVINQQTQDHPLAFVPEPIAESQLRLYPNIMVEDTAHTINKKVGWLLHGQESILVPDFNTKCQCQILGEGIGFLPDYMVREAMTQSLLVTRQIHNPRQDSRMLLATQHSATGQVTQWIKKQFAPNGILTGIYQDLLHREN